MRALIAISRVFTFTFALFVAAIPACSAAELAGRIATTDGSGSAAYLSMKNDPSRTSDVFYGTDSKGPYTLSWKPIDKFSEDVTVDGKAVQRDLEYDIDYSSGKITFYEPIAGNKAIRVLYRCNSSTATRNGSTLNTPLSLDVVNTGSSSIKFMGLYNQSTSNAAGGGSSLSTIGLAGSTKVGGVGLTTMFLTSPGGSSDSGGTGMDRSALSMTGSTKRGGLELSSSFSRVGEGFADASKYSLAQGKQSLNFAAKYQASKSLSLISSYNKAESLATGSIGDTTTTTSHGMAFNPGAASKMSFTRTDVTTESAGASTSTTSTNRLDLSQSLGSKVSASASYQDVTSDYGGTSNRTTTNQISLTAKPTNTMSIQTKLVDQTDTVTGRNQTQSINFSAAPSTKVKLDYSARHEDSEVVGSALTQSLHLVAAPLAAWKLDYSMSGASQTADTSMNTRSQALHLSTSALKNTSVQLNLRRTDAESTGDTQNTGIRVETSPVKSLKVTGQLDQKVNGDLTEQDRGAGLEITPLKNAKLSGGYKEVEKSDGTLARVTEVNASTQPVGFIKVSGGYTTRQQDGIEDVNSVDVAVKLNPGRLLSFTGAYSMNPEDSTGTVQRLNCQTLGVQSNMGFLSLNGAYTKKNDYTGMAMSQMTRFGFDMRLTPTSTLSTSYSLEDARSTTEILTSTYALTLSHRVGNSLSLHLSGKATTYQNSAGSDLGPGIYEGEASLGLKF